MTIMSYIDDISTEVPPGFRSEKLQAHLDVGAEKYHLVWDHEKD